MPIANECANEAHPDGPHHWPARRLVGADLAERCRQWFRRRAWGCPCRSKRARPIETLPFDLAVMVGKQGGGSAVLDTAWFSADDQDYQGLAIRRPLLSDRGLLKPNPFAEPCPMLVIAHLEDGRRHWWTDPHGTRDRWRMRRTWLALRLGAELPAPRTITEATHGDR